MGKDMVIVLANSKSAAALNSTYRMVSRQLLCASHSMTFTPFSDTDVHSAFRSHVDSLFREIDALDNEYVLVLCQTKLLGFTCRVCSRGL